MAKTRFSWANFPKAFLQALQTYSKEKRKIANYDAILRSFLIGLNISDDDVLEDENDYYYLNSIAKLPKRKQTSVQAAKKKKT